MQLFGVPLKLEVSIKGLQGGGLLYWLLLVFQRVNIVRHHRTLSVLYFFDCFMEEAYEWGVDVIFNYGLGRRP